MATIQIIRKGFFPINKMTIHINQQSVKLWGNRQAVIDVKNEDDIRLMMQLAGWFSKTKTIKVSRVENQILIYHALPDIFYIIGGIALMVISLLSFWDIFNMIIFSSTICIFVGTIIYYTSIRKDKYFTATFNGEKL